MDCDVRLRAFFSNVLLCAAFSLLQATPSLAWGRLGHQIIGEVAADLAVSGQEFWSPNASTIARLAVVPDAIWKSGASARSEEPTHWFHVDVYADQPWDLPIFFNSFDVAVSEFGLNTIESNGTAFWRCKQFYELARDGFRSGRYEYGLQMAGVLAHYIGDLSQPLHVSLDYDGRDGSRTGIHGFFESTIPQSRDRQYLKAQVRAKAMVLLKDPAFVATMQPGILHAVRKEISRSAPFIQDVLDADENLGRGSQGSTIQWNLALDRMADGAATYALILGQIWKDAGEPSIQGNLPVRDPVWVAPNFEFMEDRSY